jgi:hypothetical protein
MFLKILSQFFYTLDEYIVFISDSTHIILWVIFSYDQLVNMTHMNLCEISDKINDKMDVDVQGRQSIPKSGGGGRTPN